MNFAAITSSVYRMSQSKKRTEGRGESSAPYSSSDSGKTTERRLALAAWLRIIEMATKPKVCEASACTSSESSECSERSEACTIPSRPVAACAACKSVLVLASAWKRMGSRHATS